MLTLKNLRKTNEYIETDYIPENSNEVGYIKMELQTDEVIHSVKTSFDTPFPSYFSHAVSAIKKIKGKDNIPSEKLVMWY